MAFNATTLTAAIGANDTSLIVGSATGITAPNFTTGVGITILFVETEAMLVQSVNGLVIGVTRGQYGTPASAHGASCPVLAGLPSDFGTIVPVSRATQDASSSGSGFYGWSAPVAGANTNVATGSLFHLTGTTIMKTLTAPAGYIEGSGITIVFDGSAAGLTWDATGNIAVAGTATTAGSAVTFTFDQGSGKWHPSRLA